MAKKWGIRLHGVFLFILGFILFTSFIIYAAPLPQPSTDEISDSTFWKVIGAICTILMMSTAYQIRQRDKLLDKIAAVVFGSGEVQGLKTRVALLEDEIKRCVNCSPPKKDS